MPPLRPDRVNQLLANQEFRHSLARHANGQADPHNARRQKAAKRIIQQIETVRGLHPGTLRYMAASVWLASLLSTYVTDYGDQP